MWDQNPLLIFPSPRGPYVISEALLRFRVLFHETSPLPALTINTSVLFDELCEVLQGELALKSRVLHSLVGPLQLRNLAFTIF